MRAWRRRKKNELLYNTPPVGKSNRRRDPVEVSGTFSNLSLVYKICNSLYLLITKEYSLFQAKPTCNYVSMTKMTIKLPVHPISCSVRINKCLEWWGSYCFGIQACNGWFHGDSKKCNKWHGVRVHQLKRYIRTHTYHRVHQRSNTSLIVRDVDLSFC